MYKKQLIILMLSLFLSLQINAGAKEGDVAIGFTLDTANGSISLSDFKGKVVYLDFWASWCGPCRQSFPWLSQMRKKYQDQGFEVIAVNLDKFRHDANKFLKKTPAEFTVAYDPEGEMASKYDLLGMPSAYIIDRDGIIRYQHVGFTHAKKSQYEEELTILLKQK